VAPATGTVTSQESAVTGVATSLGVTHPPDLADGGVVLLITSCVRNGGGAITWTPPSGFEQRGTDQALSSGTLELTLWAKRVTDADTEGAWTVSVSHGGTAPTAANLAAIAVHVTGAEDPADIVAVFAIENVAVASFVAPTVTVDDNDSLIYAGAVAQRPGTWTPPVSGYTELADLPTTGNAGANESALCLADSDVLKAAGTESPGTFGYSQTRQGISYTIAVGPASAGLSATLGQVVETATVLSLGRSKAAALGQVTETALAQPVGHTKAAALGQANETATALPVTTPGALTGVLGQVTDTATVQALGSTKRRTVGQVTETSSALTVDTGKRRTVGIVAEASAALALVGKKALSIGTVATTSTAQALGRAKARTVGQVTETATALGIGKTKRGSLGLVSETSAALAFGRLKARVLGLVTETAIAQALGRAKARLLGQVSETDQALPVTQPDAFTGAHLPLLAPTTSPALTAPTTTPHLSAPTEVTRP
jgi:hypothetical protein